MATVATQKITRRFGDVPAVDGIDLDVKEGEFLVLLGPSGCGKTTLLRMIAGLDSPTSGEVLIGGEVVNDLPPRDRNIAMVFQSYALYPHLTVGKNIAFPLRAQSAPDERVREEVQKAAQMFGIGHLLGRKPRQLSGGERQRVALARAVVRHPQVFLLDEPLSNLDAKLRNSARAELQQFQRRLATTTVYVTHDQIEAMGLGDRVAVFNKGRMAQIGTPQEVYSDPADTFVATFLGSPPMNLVDRGAYFLGFRPEQFLPVEGAQGKGERVPFRLRLVRVENLGAEHLAYGRLEGGDPNQLLISRLPVTSIATLREGEVHEFMVPRVELRFFDRMTGKRMSPQPM
jgi:multiple sugar transport system ATP-binding protein